MVAVALHPVILFPDKFYLQSPAWFRLVGNPSLDTD